MFAEVERIKRKNRFWGDRDMMAAGGPDKRTDIGATEKT